LPANKTKQYGWGSHQNPQDLNPNNYKLVRFTERLDENGVVRWNFFPDQCRHCVEPPCKDMADTVVEGAILHDKETGAVLYTDKTRLLSEDDFASVRDACPYNIPRRDPETGLVSKCTMCNDRVHAGMLPACVKSCPTGAMNFGERDEMLTLANRRLAKVRKTFPEAMLVDPADVNVIYLIADKPEFFGEYVVAENAPSMGRRQLLAKAGRPFQGLFDHLT
jgi:formate dehydrogenase iron-sulfur subunit